MQDLLSSLCEMCCFFSNFRILHRFLFSDIDPLEDWVRVWEFSAPLIVVLFSWL